MTTERTQEIKAGAVRKGGQLLIPARTIVIHWIDINALHELEDVSAHT